MVSLGPDNGKAAHSEQENYRREKERDWGWGGVSVLVPGLHFILLTLCWQTTISPI